jgi:multidrug efflux pump
LLNDAKTDHGYFIPTKKTNYVEDGEQYDVLVEELNRKTRSPFDLSNIYVRSESTQELIPLQNLISQKESASSRKLNRHNKLRSITLEAGLADDMQLGKALEIFEEKVKELLPDGTLYDYQGESKSFKDAEQSIYFTFLLAILVVYLVMAGQFESFLNPLVIMFTVPFAILGGLASIILFNQSINIYSQIAMIMLIGVATKNGILIVEFINQLRQEGQDLIDAVLNASAIRLRPIIMTSTTTVVGTIPLVLSSGAGQEARIAIGTTILGGLLCTMIFTLYIVPSIYFIMNRKKVFCLR